MGEFTKLAEELQLARDKCLVQVVQELLAEKLAQRFDGQKEFDVLKAASSEIMKLDDPLYKALYNVNCELWEIEDRIRDLERKKDFGSEFIETARSVYFKNDKRSDIKREINLKTSSGLIEEKSYEKY